MFEEVVLVIFCDPNSKDGKVVHNNFLTVRCVGRANAAGLLACLRAAMGYVGVANSESKLIGVGCDGANINLGTTGGLKGLLTEMKCKTLGAYCISCVESYILSHCMCV